MSCFFDLTLSSVKVKVFSSSFLSLAIERLPLELRCLGCRLLLSFFLEAFLCTASALFGSLWLSSSILEKNSETYSLSICFEPLLELSASSRYDRSIETPLSFSIGADCLIPDTDLDIALELYFFISILYSNYSSVKEFSRIAIDQFLKMISASKIMLTCSILVFP